MGKRIRIVQDDTGEGCAILSFACASHHSILVTSTAFPHKQKLMPNRHFSLTEGSLYRPSDDAFRNTFDVRSHALWLLIPPSFSMTTERQYLRTSI